MAYCEDCGLSSCYIRGGYCATSIAKARALAKALRPKVVWFMHDSVKHHLLAGYLQVPGLYPQLSSDEWIEVVW